MTERNFTEVIPGFYRTRGGEIAEVVQIVDPRLKASGAYPALGLMGSYQEAWTIHGLGVAAKPKSHTDLIEYLGAEKPKEKKVVKKTLTGLVNVYANGGMAIYATAAFADYYHNGRIACVEMTGEYEVEEEV